jgi:3-isopropylmalate dehydratase small subunit
MSIQKELEDLIKNEVLIEIEDYIDELFEIIAAKKEDDDIKEELKHIQEMKKDFEDMLVDLANGEIDDEEAQEIIEEINDMRKEQDEEDEDEE